MTKFKRRILLSFLLLMSFVGIFLSFDFLLCDKRETLTADAATTSDLTFAVLSDETYSVKAVSTSISGALTIPSTYNGKSVTVIEDYAFRDCTLLTEITIPNSVISIGKYSFNKCTSLTEIKIPNSVNVIRQGAFRDCTSLTSITIGTNVTSIAPFALYNCTSLISIYIPNSVTSIGDYAFTGCASLTKIAIPDSVRSIKQYGFYNCTSLETICYIGTSEKWAEVSIGSNAISSTTTVICVGDTPNTLSTGLDNYAETTQNVRVTYGGYNTQGYYSVSSTSYSTSATTQFDNGTTFSHDGYYCVVARNGYLNYVVRYFRIDKTPPIGTLTGVVNGGYTNGSVLFTWTDEGATATLNGKSYTSGTKITAEGSYTIVLADKAGNSTTYTFTIDKTPPVGTLTTMQDGGFLSGNLTNGNVSFSWIDSESTAKLDGKSYLSGTKISAEGTHKIVLTDRSGNSTTYAFTIDKTAPTGTLATTQDGGFRTGNLTNGNVSFSWTGKDATATLNGLPYSKGVSITAERSHTIVLTDRAGNSTTYTFTIDKTAPTGTLTGVSNGGYTNGSVSFSWTESGATATLNGRDYDSGTKKTAEGSYTIVLSDLAGNSTTYTFTIDKTAPTGTLTGVTNGGYTNGSVSFSWTDEDATATLNGISYSKGVAITAERSHTIVLTDRAGNSTTYTFTIDKTPPTGTLTGVTDGGYTNGAVSFSWDEDDATATLNNKDYDSGTKKTAEGSYTIVLTDKAGNSTTYTFTIDKTPPTGTLTGVTDGGYTNGSVSFSWTEEGATATLNAKEYTKEMRITAEDKYTLVLTDRAKNSTTYVFTIDKTAPTGTLTGVTDGGYTNESVSFSWAESGTTATLNGKDYDSGTNITAERSHTIVLTDRAGNSTTYTFTIDMTPPVGTLTGVIDGGYTNGTVSFSWTEDGASATLNGAAYTSSKAISDEDKYTLVLTDRAGNGTTYTFTIDKTAPMGTLTGVTNGGYTNGSVSFSWLESGVTATLNGSDYDSGTNITAERSHTIVLTDRAGNSTTYTFTIDKTPPVGTLSGVTDGGYTNGSVSFSWTESGATATLNEKEYTKEIRITVEDKYTLVLTDRAKNSTTYTFTIDKTPPIGTLTGVSNGGYTNGSVSFSWLESGATATLNGKEYDGDTKITTERAHTIILTDHAGNSTIYTFTIDKTAPTGTLSGVTNGGYTNGSVSFSWDEDGATATLNGVAYTKGSSITAERSHTIVLTDHAGNSTTYTFTIDKTPPTGTLTGVTDGGYTNGSVSFSWSESGATATLNGTPYSKGISISAECSHTIVLTDRAGNSTTYTFTIDKTPPVGTLIGVTNGGYTNGYVSFSWTDSGATATLNGTPYSKGISISAECSHTIVLTDRAGNSTTYTFTIDKTPPVGTLAGVSNGGYTNGSVSFSWTDEGATATLNGSTYASEKTISAERVHTIVLTDLAGNSTTYTFTIDKTAPTGTLTGVTNGGYTNESVSFSWAESGTTATLNGKDYDSGTNITAESSHTIVLTDLAGNSTTYTFTIDKTAPTITGSVSSGEHTSSDVVIAFSDGVSGVTAKYGQSADGIPPAVTQFSSGRKFTVEGYYVIVATDGAGNSTDYQFVIDKSSPVIGAFKEYTNEEFTITAEDKYGSVGGWEYRLNDGDVQRGNGISITLGGGESSNGVWDIRVIDELGNTSNWITVNFAYRTEFGNSENIYNSFSVPSFYVVTLSQKFFPSVYGSYTFAEYEYAYNFAVSKEWECRVIVLDGGESWNYVTVTNENTRQIYTDRAELDGVIENYAKRNIGERKVVGQNGTALNNPTDEAGVTRKDALTAQLTVLPEILSEYSELCFMFAHTNYTLQTPKSIVTGNMSTATVQFISDGISLRGGEETLISYGEALQTVISEQGWYLITERDTCGNVEKYLIYADMQYPELQAKVMRGSGEVEWITYNAEYVDANRETMRYISLEFTHFADEADGYAMLAIEGRDLNARYVSCDNIPILSYANGYYGAYTITVYDRSYNALTFTVYIAGETPLLRHTSLNNDTSVTFTVQCNDTRNEITDIKFYKIHFDGTEERLYEDSYGTAVSVENLVYKMNVGGKYVFEFTDLYGRTVRTEPLFYMKGLPTAIIRGVKDGGITKNDVSITYQTAHTAELFVRYGGGWEPAELYSVSEGADSYTINITAGADTTAVYKVLLYVTEDRNLFTEYTFEIDGILPQVQTLTKDGETVEPETVTVQDFYVTWQESGYKAYYKRLGAITDTQYQKDTFISVAGTYTFTFYDEAHNELSFTVTLDNTVSYTLQGTYTLLEDGSLITKNYLTFTLTEPWSEFSVVASNGSSVTNGQRLDTDGTYNIAAKDMYGNALTLTLIVDKLPPKVTIMSDDGSELTDGARTKEAFRVIWTEQNITATCSENNGGYKIYEGGLVDAEGTYSFRLSDRVGNETLLKVIIDRKVAYQIEGTYIQTDGKLYSRYGLRVLALEEFAVFEINDGNGSLCDTTKKISEEGAYAVRMVDVAGNSAELNLVIDKTAPALKFVTVSGQAVQNGVTNEAFRAICEEEGAVIKYGFKGATAEQYNGEELNIEGDYEFTVTDKLGNANTLIITIDREVLYRIEGNYAKFDDALFSKSWLQVIALEDLTVFEIKDGNDALLDTTERISEEGVYIVHMVDIAGNAVELKLVIDKTAPALEVVTVSGKTVQNGVTNEAFKAVCKEVGAVIKYGFNGATAEQYNGEELNAEGDYEFIVSDKLGNANTLTITIDCKVLYRIEGNYAEFNSVLCSKSWLQIIALEELSAFEINDGNGSLCDTMKKISEEGTYAVHMVDVAGNKLELNIVIDKTAPALEFVTASGQVVQNGVTNEAFIAVCAEEDAVINYSFNGATAEQYNGEELNVEGNYEFVVADKLGNSNTLIVVIDREVLYRIEGTYIEKDGRYCAKTSLQVVALENLTAFEIKDGSGNLLDTTKKISEEGTYAVHMVDVAGNSVELNIVIDKTAPALEFVTASGKTVQNGVTNEAFRAVCDEEDVVINNSFSGAVSELYNGEELNAAGKYKLTVSDKLGNTAVYEISIDYTIQYRVDGNYIEYDGKLYSKTWLHIISLEDLTVFEIEDSKDNLLDTTKKITEEGTYAVHMVDIAGNKLELNIVIDKTAPALEFVTASGKTVQNGVTNEAFRAVCDEEDAVIKYSFNGAVSELYNGEELNAAGKYEFVVADKLGNSNTLIVVIDREVLYRIEGNYAEFDGVLCSKTGLQVIALEELSVFDIVDGSGRKVDSTKKLIAEGCYTVQLIDIAGNEVFLTLVIDNSAPLYTVANANGIALGGKITNEAFQLLCAEDGTTITYSFNGSDYSAYNNDLFKDEGAYKFVISDKLGNTEEFTVIINYTVSYRIDGAYIFNDNIFYSKSWLQVVALEELSVFIIEDCKGNPVDVVNKISIEGTYSVHLIDMVGNEVRFVLVIDNSAPVAEFITASGKTVQNGVTNEAFRAVCAEEDAVIKYSFNGAAIQDYSGEKLNVEGNYEFTVSDKLGNTAMYEISIDYTIQYRVDGNYTEYDGKLYSKTWLQIVALEGLTVFDIEDSKSNLLDTTKKITEEGTYIVHMVDVAGNKLELNIVIDKTAPALEFVTASGKTVQNGVTNEAFRAVCDEEDTVIKYSFNGAVSELYNGEELNAAGKYEFVVADKLGNSNTLIVVIDREVLYRIEGTHIEKDGRYCAKTGLQIISLEDLSVFEIEDGNGSLCDKTKKISEEGAYMVRMVDVAGNKLELNIVIDKTAPALGFITASGQTVQNSVTTEAFRAVCAEEDAVINYSFSGAVSELYNGEELNAAGKYEFVVADKLGNSNTIIIVIDREVLYRIEGTYIEKDGRYCAKTGLQVISLEDLSVFEIEDGKGNLLDTTKKITEEGTYTVHMVDVVGNAVKLKLVIDKTAPATEFVTEDGETVRDVTNQNFKLVCGELDAVIKYNYNGLGAEPYNGEYFSNEGKYVFEAIDYLGNVAEIKLTVDKSVLFTVNGTFVIDENRAYISKTRFAFILEEDMRFFEVVAWDGTVYGTDSKITEEGVYTLTAEDMYGNRVQQTLVIDKTPPAIILNGVEDGKGTNEIVTVKLNDCASAYYSLNGGEKTSCIDGAKFSNEGLYTITAKDLVGNISKVSFTVDLHVDVIPSVQLAPGQIITGSVSFKFDENVKALLIRNGIESIYTRGEIGTAGEYSLFITDDLGNEKVFYWAIVEERAQSYTLNFADGTAVTIEKDGVLFTDVDNGGGQIILNETGSYILNCVNGTEEWSLNLEVDNVAPTLIFENTGKSVKVSNQSDKKLTYSLYLNGEQKSFDMKSTAEFTQVGMYRLVCTDDVGNVTEYVFELNYLSDVSIALIAVTCALVFGGIITLIIFRFKKRSF